jgi:hypothetical protein
MFQPRYVPAPVKPPSPGGGPQGRVPFRRALPPGYCDDVTEQHQAASLEAASASAAEQPGYPGEDLGLPETGRGSVSGWGRRIAALFIDWFLCSAIVIAFIRPPHGTVEYWTLALFAAQDIIFTALTGLTVGKLLMRIRVARLDGKLIGPLWALVRTVLMLLVVPPLVADKDMRGLHDRASNTVVVRF